jgi:hypothetical protein
MGVDQSKGLMDGRNVRVFASTSDNPTLAPAFAACFFAIEYSGEFFN